MVELLNKNDMLILGSFNRLPFFVMKMDNK